jgi:acylphosphatase
VQGVGFRYTAQSVASRHAVKGYVRNLPDGRVELVMEGAEAEMEEIVREIEQKLDGFVSGRTDQVSPATGEFEDFAIRH